MPRDPYATLGVPRDATPDQIAASYRALVRALHPDSRADTADPARLDEVTAALEGVTDLVTEQHAGKAA